MQANTPTMEFFWIVGGCQTLVVLWQVLSPLSHLSRTTGHLYRGLLFCTSCLPGTIFHLNFKRIRTFRTHKPEHGYPSGCYFNTQLNSPTEILNAGGGLENCFLSLGEMLTLLSLTFPTQLTLKMVIKICTCPWILMTANFS